MKRFIDKHLEEWKSKQGFKPLLLRGARQVGKTYAVRNLGKSFENFVEINLEFNPDLKSIFKLNLDPVRILKEIYALTNKKIIPGSTLLFFDEVQSEPQVVLALRYFYELMPNLHVIAAGSLLDFAIEAIGVPVGRVEFLYMYPLSFYEFLNALGAEQLLEEVVNHDINQQMSEVLHNKLLRYIGEYLAVGGMPEVVYSWSVDGDPIKCFDKIQTLINAYRQDFVKYAKRSQIQYLDILLEDVPRQLGKKFKFSNVPGEFRKRELSPCMDLLVTAGVVNKIYHTDAQGLPLGAQVDPDNFKLIFLDVALAQSILGLNLADWLLDPEKQFVNKGEIVEAFIGQEILAYSNYVQKQNLYYWLRTERTAQAEIDYVVNVKNVIIPIEVKGGAGSTLRSLHMFLNTHKTSAFGIRFSAQNYSVFENIYSYPLYAVFAAIKKDLSQFSNKK